MTETEHYRAFGYTGLPGLFPSIVLNGFYEQMRCELGLSERARHFTMRGPLISKDAIEVYSNVYPPMMTFLWGLTPRIAQATQCDLLPTYAYFRLYQKGDICRVHSDRLACEHSLSLTIAYGDDVPWALSVGSDAVEPSGLVKDDFEGAPYGSVAMHPGDGVLYQGIHRRHGRLSPNPNSWSAHLFLHWVDARGRYAEQAFDRPALSNAGASR
ncbi:hypothetical protein ASG11_12025 [Sphingomonas sp. Leaf357]|uniref:hypothetical protein n=1 Tax=Sphingomonas sp. Leaf357 TaxID=1736350 RepID=UPI0006F215D2|nr:hypothetical protein [Sphingomonas sp. Leaf357]KQS04888.1 hypothetical protein ASG11_12025 [Sphingomonas sp. Leaf357]